MCLVGSAGWDAICVKGRNRVVNLQYSPEPYCISNLYLPRGVGVSKYILTLADFENDLFYYNSTSQTHVAT